MALVARASTTVRNKNFLMILLCAGFLSWFAYDGFVSYPRSNDALVARMRDAVKDSKVSEEFLPELDAWKGWDHETAAAHQRMDEITRSSKNRIDIEGWKGPFDIQLQRGIVFGLIAATLAAIAWTLYCQRRRAIAEEGTVSPAPGVIVPWANITQVDNTRWKTMGIVDIRYKDDHGKEGRADFDDYKLEREPLLAILDQLAEKAVNAEFIPKEEPPPPEPPAADASPKP